jgi:hypothetical protein
MGIQWLLHKTTVEIALILDLKLLYHLDAQILCSMLSNMLSLETFNLWTMSIILC